MIALPTDPIAALEWMAQRMDIEHTPYFDRIMSCTSIRHGSDCNDYYDDGLRPPAPPKSAANRIICEPHIMVSRSRCAAMTWSPSKDFDTAADLKYWSNSNDIWMNCVALTFTYRVSIACLSG